MRQNDTPPATVPAAFAAATSDPARPLLTWYDDATGERAELSGATCANWVAKTANLLVDGCGLAPGEVAVVDAPPHWQTAAVMLGCWSAGLVVAGGEVAPASGGAEVVFAAADRAAGHAGRGPEIFGLALAPLAAPMRDAPPGVADFVLEVRAHGDHFQPYAPVAPGDPATTLCLPPKRHFATPLRPLTHQELCRTADARAGELGIAAGGRVLIDVTAYPDPLDWLLAPLVAGASMVLCGHLDPASLPARSATERVDLTLT